MDFALSEEQQFLQTTVTEFLANNCTLDRVRECVKESQTSDPSLTEGLVSLGVPGVVIPEEFGGTELGYLEAALIAEALGGAIAPFPYIGTSVIAPYLLTLAGSDEQRADFLPKIASGEVRFAIAFTESIARRVTHPTEVTNGRLTGEQTFVIDGNDCEMVLVSIEGGRVFLVDSSTVEREVLKSIDQTRSLASLKLDNTPGDVLPGTVDNPSMLSHALDLGRIMIAADTLGAAQTMLEKSVDYAGERKQFNRVIGSFQAVKHMCAEMAAELEPCRSLVWYAAHSMLAIPSETHVVACHAKAHLSEVGQFVARKATEVHGGMGFTDLLGLHYWFKRIGLNRQLLGTPDQVREDAARAQGW
ncbi:MAG: acyl-CoA/acyl-ACP dehydrogenase [Gammaproteobacteria bacterium]|nr:acyl-CoA/acyl-ACP dehydrogenase [Gammaproteobacteria bacterium]